jgi:hypothetical protein
LCKTEYSLVRDHPLYHSWVAMRRRCRGHKYYGARGIAVCDEWHDFVQFLTDMGERPAGHTIDRIDNDNGYSKENCRWATRAVQNINRRPQGKAIIPGVRLCELTNKYRVTIQVQGKCVTVGRYDKRSDAVAVRLAMEESNYGVRRKQPDQVPEPGD